MKQNHALIFIVKNKGKNITIFLKKDEQK